MYVSNSGVKGPLKMAGVLEYWNVNENTQTSSMVCPQIVAISKDGGSAVVHVDQDLEPHIFLRYRRCSGHLQAVGLFVCSSIARLLIFTLTNIGE